MKKYLVFLLLLIVITGCDILEKKYSIKDSVVLSGTIKNDNNKKTLVLDKPIKINDELIEEIDLETSVMLKDDTHTEVSGIIDENKSLKNIDIKNLNSYIYNYHNNIFSFSIPKEIVSKVIVEEINNGFIIYSIENNQKSYEVLRIISISSKEFIKVQKESNMFIEKAASNKDNTVIIKYPNDKNYYGSEYEEICNKIINIKNTIQLVK